MKIHSVQLISKNNKRNGFYLYTPVVELDGKFFWCKSIKTSKPITHKDVSIDSIKLEREIPKEFYKPNNITT